MNRPETRIGDAGALPVEAIKGDAPLRILLPSYRSDPHTCFQDIDMTQIYTALVRFGHHVDISTNPTYAV